MTKLKKEHLSLIKFYQMNFYLTTDSLYLEVGLKNMLKHFESALLLSPPTLPFFFAAVGLHEKL